MEDVIFLLSEHEYMKYRESIPKLNVNWWLRSPGYIPGSVAFVVGDGSLSYDRVNYAYICIRPALYLDKVKIDENNFVYCGITWVKISKNIAISELPISMRNFNKNLNNIAYENSDIRKWLLEWHEKRKNY